ncbi:hypothetical protein LAZ67_12000211, partial [Cordylochernes scorpioides]
MAKVKAELDDIQEDLKQAIDILKEQVKKSHQSGNAMFFKEAIEDIPEFDGSTVPIKKWLQEIDDNAIIFGWTDLHTLVVAKKLLTGVAKLWLRKKQQFESYYEYFLNMRELGSQGNLEEAVIIQYVIDGIPDQEFNKSILYGSTSYSDFKIKLKNYEMIKSKSKTNSTTSKVIPKPIDDKESKCFNCGKRGHLSCECRFKDLGKKCFSCNSFGHIANQCPTRSNVNTLVKQVQKKPQDEKQNYLAETTQKGPMFKVIKINDHELQALIDIGSQLNLIRIDRYLAIGSPSFDADDRFISGIANERDRYPLPLIEDQIDKLQATRLFSTIDLKIGFFHIPVAEDSRKLTSFVVPNGQYEFLKTPFGLCNAPAKFQRFINSIFAEEIQKGIVFTYLDDIVIPANDAEEALRRLKHVLKRAEEYGLQINWEKCQILKSEITYLEHEIKDGVIRPSDDKEKQVYDGYFEENNLLWKEVGGNRTLVIPKRMEMEIIKLAHEERHFGIQKNFEMLKKEYYITDLKSKIKKYIQNCIPCILSNRKHGEQEGMLHPISKGDTPLDTYHIDHLGPLASTRKDYNYLLVITDGFTKFTWIYPTKTTRTSEVIQKLECQQQIFGNPRRIITDQGTAFTSNDFKEYCKEESIEHCCITTGVPRGNGQVERINCTIVSVLTKLSIINPQEWHKHVRKLQKALNSTHQRSIRMSPFELLVGVKMRKEEYLRLLEMIEEELALTFDEERDQKRKAAKQEILKIQEENRNTFNKKRKKAYVYKEGDLVVIQKTQFATKLKLYPKYIGPYKVIKIKPNDRYNVEKFADFEGPNRTCCSADLMKPWFTQDEYPSELSKADEVQDGR